ncbi:MAG: hypothetical protein K1X88_06325, partial [Nannocystaceae bacterium]|nr:hypothetical protein [Nannocystaceae bacterium]
RTAGPAAPREAVHGRLTHEHGQRVLRVWGTPRQRGYAHGALLRDGIVDVVAHYALEVISPAELGLAATAMAGLLDVPPSLREEAEGVIAGMRDHGGVHIDALQRALDADDLLALNAMADLVRLGCSSLSAWGETTAGELDGATSVVRNLDWSDDPELLAQQLVIVSRPDDPARMTTVSVGFSGYIACLSCINEAGVTALFNLGPAGEDAGLLAAAGGFAPANLLLRDAIERRDIDGDGRTSAADVESAVRGAHHAGRWLVHLLEPRQDGAAPATVLEVDAQGVVRRDASGTHLAATNHFRSKDEPLACPRYRRLQRGVDRAPLDRSALWQLGRSVRLPAVVYQLAIEPDTRALSLWLRAPGEAADHDATPVAWSWDALVAGLPAG